MPVSGRPRHEWPASPPWSAASRLWALTMVVVLLVYVWWSLRQFTIIVVSAVLLAYILNPAIVWLRRRLRTSHARAALAVYTVLAVVAAFVPALLAPGVARGLLATDLAAQWERIVGSVFADLPSTVELAGRELALEPLYAEVQGQLATAEATVLGRTSLVWLLGMASDFAFTLFGVFFTFVASLYVAMDGERFTGWIARKVPAPYHPALDALTAEIGRVWQSFFRGQLLLAAVVGLLTGIGLVALGVPYAVPLAVVAGVLEVIPRLGPVLSVVPAAAVALVQPSSTLPIGAGGWFVLLVAALYIVVQQVENNVLVPRILGGSVDLPAVVVLVGALGGAALAGVPGILLAAPVLGSARVLGSWVFEQITRFDPPAAPPVGAMPPDSQPPDCPGANVRV